MKFKIITWNGNFTLSKVYAELKMVYVRIGILCFKRNAYKIFHVAFSRLHYCNSFLPTCQQSCNSFF